MATVGGSKREIIGVRVAVLRGTIRNGETKPEGWTWQATITLEGGEQLTMSGSHEDRHTALAQSMQALDVLDALNRIGASSTGSPLSAVRP